MKILRVELENFQSHKNTIIDFSEGFTCIVGSTNKGKSSIERAISFVLYNDFESDFVTIGESVCRVTLVLSTGVTLSRVKGTKINKYIIKYPDGVSKEICDFGISVPEEVKQLIGLDEIQIGDDLKIRLNVHKQDDGYFLLNLSDGLKNKFFSSISNLDKITQAIKTLNQDKKANKEHIKGFTELLNEKLKLKIDLEASINECKKLNDIRKDLVSILEKIQLLNTIIKLKQEYDKIVFLINVYSNILSNININALRNNINKLIFIEQQKENLLLCHENIKWIDTELSKQLYAKQDLSTKFVSLVSSCQRLKQGDCPLL